MTVRTQKTTFPGTDFLPAGNSGAAMSADWLYLNLEHELDS